MPFLKRCSSLVSVEILFTFFSSSSNIFSSSILFHFEPLVVIRLLFLFIVSGWVFSSVLVLGNLEGDKCASNWALQSAWARSRCSEGEEELLVNVVVRHWAGWITLSNEKRSLVFVYYLWKSIHISLVIGYTGEAGTSVKRDSLPHITLDKI